MSFSPEQLQQITAHFLSMAQNSGGPAHDAAIPAPPISAPAGPAAAPAAVSVLIPPTTGNAGTPITNRYESGRTTIGLGLPSSHGQLGHPVPPQAVPGPSQPFLGFHALEPPNVRQANQARLAAAAVNIPRQPALPARRGRATRNSGQRAPRSRGISIHPPSLPRVQARDPVGACIYNQLNDDGQNNDYIRLKFRIRPELNQDQTESDIIVYENLGQTTDQWLENHHLIQRFDVSVRTPMVEVIKLLVARLERSPFDYQFIRPPAGVSEHEGLPIQLLSYRNRGYARPNGQVRLRRYALTPGDIVSTLVGNKIHFANNKLCNENDHFVFNCLIVTPYTILSQLSGSDPYARIHTCISLKFYHRFPTDNVADVNSEDISSDEDVEEIDINTLPHSIRPRRPRHLQSTPTRNSRELSPSLPSFPSTIWDSPFIASAGRFSSVLIRGPLADQAYDLATEGIDAPNLSISGISVAEVAQGFRELLADCLNANDFTRALSPNRAFDIIDHRGETVSIGEGLEREAIQLLIERIRALQDEYMLPLAGELCTLATSHDLTSSQHVSKARLDDMALFGCLVSFSLIRGISPNPLSPLVVQYLIHGCDIRSIDEALVREWLPSLHTDLENWVIAGPHGDITSFASHFATYHNMQIGCLRQRDTASHASMAVSMLKNATIGPAPHTHPEWLAFIKGFTLRCSNGFTFPEFARSVEGGSNAMLSEVWCSLMNSWDRLRPHTSFSEAPMASRNRLRASLGDSSLTFRSIMETFMEGAGVPNSRLFTEAATYFDAIVDVNAVGELGYRAKHFCWASTGSYQMEPGSNKLSICFVDDNDITYPSISGRAAMLADGKVCFRTCLSKAIIPASYILRLSEAQYPSDLFECFQDAFDHWMLCEILNGIASHTII